MKSKTTAWRALNKELREAIAAKKARVRESFITFKQAQAGIKTALWEGPVSAEQLEEVDRLERYHLGEKDKLAILEKRLQAHTDIIGQKENKAEKLESLEREKDKLKLEREQAGDKILDQIKELDVEIDSWRARKKQLREELALETVPKTNAIKALSRKITNLRKKLQLEQKELQLKAELEINKVYKK